MHSLELKAIALNKTLIIIVGVLFEAIDLAADEFEVKLCGLVKLFSQPVLGLSCLGSSANADGRWSLHFNDAVKNIKQVRFYLTMIGIGVSLGEEKSAARRNASFLASASCCL